MLDVRVSPDTVRALLVGILLVAIVWWAIGLVAGVLLLFVLAAVVAFVLAPLVDLCEWRLRLPRTLGILLAYMLLLLTLIGIGFVLVPPLAAQARDMAGLIPSVTRQFADPATPWYQAAQALGIGPDAANLLSAVSLQMQSYWDDIARELFLLARGIGTLLIDGTLILVISFYMLTGQHSLRSALGPVVPPSQVATLAQIESRLGGLLGRYLRARLVLSLVVGILSGGAAYVIGLPFPVVLGAIAAVFELIPFIGPVLGAIPALAVALAEGPPLRVAAVFLAFVSIQQIEGNVLAPKLVGDAVHIPPLLVIFSVLVGAELAGAWGALLAAPLAGCIGVVFREITAARSELAAGTDETGDV